jgi:outer membrane protein OmpA-like peptidoglycan-associated protein
MKKQLLLFVSLTFLVLGTAFSQNSLLRYADKQFELSNYKHAADMYVEAYGKKATYSTAQKAAHAFTRIQDYDLSYEWWQKTISYSEAGKEDAKQYMFAALKAGKGNKPEEILAQTRFSKNDLSDIDFKALEALYQKRSNVKLTPVAGINSDGADYGLSMDADGNRYFTSDRGQEVASTRAKIRLDAKNNLFSDAKSNFNDRQYFKIYQLNKDGKTIALKSDLANGLQFSDPFVFRSGQLMAYTAFRDLSKEKFKKSTTVNPELWFSELSSTGTLTATKAFPLNQATSYGVMNPFVDETASRIYFASDMPGGFGGYDLYYVDYQADLSISEPVNLGPGINTEKDESHPFVSHGLLFFSSKGHLGLGGMDVFQASLTPSGFGPVENLGQPFNSSRDDFAYAVGLDGKRYLSSDRTGSMKMDNIYLIEELHKKLLARVIDCDGNLITEAYDTQLTQVEGARSLSTKRNEKGELTADLDPDQDFILSLGKKGYFSITDSALTTKGLEAETLEKEYRLVAIPYNLPVYVDIVYYDLDKSLIRKDAVPVLNKVGELMQKYSFLDLIVGAHTDSRASNSYNEALSKRRADAVKDFLTTFAVDPERVKLEWYGEEQLSSKCPDGVPCPEAAHQLNRRSELLLEAFGDKNKQYDLPKEFMGKDICDPRDLLEALQAEMNAIPTIYFDFDKATLRQVHQKELERVGIMLKKMPNLNLAIGGHTDQRGSEDYNLELSQRRAKAVMNYLVDKGVAAERMQFEYFGKRNPVKDCSTGNCDEATHQLNRRTELLLKK